MSVGNTGMLGNISFAYNTWTHVAFQYNNQTKQQVRVFLFFFSVWWWSSNTCNYLLWLLIVCQVVRDYPSLLKHQIKATQQKLRNKSLTSLSQVKLLVPFVWGIGIKKKLNFKKIKSKRTHYNRTVNSQELSFFGNFCLWMNRKLWIVFPCAWNGRFSITILNITIYYITTI